MTSKKKPLPRADVDPHAYCVNAIQSTGHMISRGVELSTWTALTDQWFLDLIEVDCTIAMNFANFTYSMFREFYGEVY